MRESEGAVVTCSAGFGESLGADGGLDFQCIRVCDEQKLVVQLKNKGKYDIGFRYV